MACKVKIDTIKYLQKKGAINDRREVLNLSQFNTLNMQLTHRAQSTYGLPAYGNLFSTVTKSVPRVDGSRRSLIRAVPNEQLFNNLQTLMDAKLGENSSDSKSIFSIQKPLIEYNMPTDEELLDTPDPINALEHYKKIKEDIDKFNDFINCLWP